MPDEFGTTARANGFAISAPTVIVRASHALSGKPSMSHTHLSLRVHLVWATKGRRPWLDREWRSRLFACAAVIIARKHGKLLCAGGARDHVHLYVEPPATITIAELVGVVKANTARWIHKTVPHRRDFSWQNGYAAFTVSGADDASLRDYIRNQEHHHKEKPFTGEYLSLLHIHGIEYDMAHALD